MNDDGSRAPRRGAHPGRRRGPAGGVLLAATIASAVLLTACTVDGGSDPTATSGRPSEGSSSTPPESSTPTPTPTPTTADPVISRVSTEQWALMVERGVWRPGCPLGRKDLRRIDINHVDFDGKVQRGVLVVNADIARSTSRIFSRLFREQFPIRQMQPLEVYDGDSTASLADDNTSAYNCRRPDQINAPFGDSPHANGRAIDINPLENPWMDLRCTCWAPSAEFRERSEGPGKILDGGLVWRTFINEGWIWQNIKVPDYMHFDTGYPSGPFTDAAAG